MKKTLQSGMFFGSIFAILILAGCSHNQANTEKTSEKNSPKVQEEKQKEKQKENKNESSTEDMKQRVDNDDDVNTSNKENDDNNNNDNDNDDNDDNKNDIDDNAPSLLPELTAEEAKKIEESKKENEETKEKTVVMTSFVEVVDGKYFPQFSNKEVTVKKGDKVKFKITNTKGIHDFKIDEFNVFAETPEGEEVTIEFTADKVGEFIYYCNKPGHRQNGHWGTLKVIE